MKDNFKKKVLKNGMTIVFEKRDLPVVSMLLGTRCGSNTEKLHEKGISHFIEHLLYKGTKSRTSKQLAEEIEKKGGMLDGFTSEEMTGYWCKMPAKNYRVGFEVLLDMIKNPLFDEKEIDKERKVIFEEMKLHKDNPMLKAMDGVRKCLYGGTMGQWIGGTEETMNSITRKDILNKFKDSYRTGNLVLCVVGDADLEYIVSQAEKIFKKEKERISYEKVIIKNEVLIEERKGIDQANLIFAYHVPLAGDFKSNVARVLTTLMAEGMSSRLFREIREKQNLAYGVQGASHIGKRIAHNFVYIGTMKKNVEKVKRIILKEFEKVSKNFDEKELNSIKNQMIGNYQISMEDSQTQSENLFVEEIITKAEDFYDFEKEINKIKVEDVKEMASKVKEGNFSFFALVPED